MFTTIFFSLFAIIFVAGTNAGTVWSRYDTKCNSKTIAIAVEPTHFLRHRHVVAARQLMRSLSHGIIEETGSVLALLNTETLGKTNDSVIYLIGAEEMQPHIDPDDAIDLFWHRASKHANEAYQMATSLNILEETLSSALEPMKIYHQRLLQIEAETSETEVQSNELVALVLINRSPFREDGDDEEISFEHTMNSGQGEETVVADGSGTSKFPVKRVVVCLSCPVDQCHNKQGDFIRRLQRLAGGSLLDVLCLGEFDSQTKTSLIVENILQNICEEPSNCRKMYNEIVSGEIGTIEAYPYHFKASIGGGHCSDYVDCTLLSGLGTDHLLETKGKCPSGTFFSQVISSCISHDEGKNPCQPDFCVRDVSNENSAVSKLAEAANELANRAEALGTKIDTKKLLKILSVNETSYAQQCISLGAATGNCRAFATCHPSLEQTLLHCCPPGRHLAPGTCSCVEGGTECSSDVQCWADDNYDMIWAELLNEQIVQTEQNLTTTEPTVVGRVKLQRQTHSRRNRVGVRSLSFMRMFHQVPTTTIETVNLEEIVEEVPTTTKNPLPFYCTEVGTGQRRKGPIPNIDAENVFYVHDWMTNQWYKGDCGALTFSAQSCSCA